MSLDQPPNGAAALPVPTQPQQPLRPPRPSLVTPPPMPAEPATDQVPAAEPVSGNVAELPRRRWFGGEETEAPTTSAPGTAAASDAKPPLEVKKEIKSLTADAIKVASRGVHFLLAAHDPPQRAASVWIADAEQVEKMAVPAAKLITGAVPPELLQTTVVYALQLALGIGHYVTEHLALRQETRTKPGREMPTLDHTGAMSA